MWASCNKRLPPALPPSLNPCVAAPMGILRRSEFQNRCRSSVGYQPMPQNPLVFIHHKHRILSDSVPVSYVRLKHMATRTVVGNWEHTRGEHSVERPHRGRGATPTGGALWQSSCSRPATARTRFAGAPTAPIHPTWPSRTGQARAAREDGGSRAHEGTRAQCAAVNNTQCDTDKGTWLAPTFESTPDAQG